ncbi:tetratricopeptide repeat protein [Streptomyces sp. NPDC088910]|uniref:tetratricopeptide repeat protein n=1 Tax=Streptomyces sp. NPDC088910 TaxID=3365911 RepID=UPI00380CFF7F
MTDQALNPNGTPAGADAPAAPEPDTAPAPAKARARRRRSASAGSPTRKGPAPEAPSAAVESGPEQPPAKDAEPSSATGPKAERTAAGPDAEPEPESESESAPDTPAARPAKAERTAAVAPGTENGSGADTGADVEADPQPDPTPHRKADPKADPKAGTAPAAPSDVGAGAARPVSRTGEVTVRVGAAVWAGAQGEGQFVGRERELAELRGEIGRPGLGKQGKGRARVLLVAGRPGVGRTALALRLAEDLADDYPDGQVFLRMTSPEGEPVPAEQAVRALRRALARTPGADGSAAPVTPAAPAPAAPSGGPAATSRKTLLVLDDVLRADQLDGLIPDAPGSLVVVTSDGPLPGVPDVRPCTLGGLDTPAAVELLAHSIGSTRVTCDPRAAEALVQEIGGHPTALRLVAAWLAARPTLSVADAATRLRTVSADAPAAPSAEADRTAPLRAAAQGELVRSFRLVYEDVPQTAARMLRLLSLAPAGMVDAQVASALAGCSVAAAQSTLDDFVGGALLAPGPVTGDELPPQYRLPGCFEPLLRGLLESRDRPEEVRLARARMLERTVRLLLSCGSALVRMRLPDDGPRSLSFDSPATAAEWLRSRLPALLASARVAVADGDLDTLARRLIAAQVQALAAFPGGNAMAAEQYELHGLVLDVAERRGLDREKAAALINLGDLDAAAGRSDRALDRYRAALGAARKCDDAEAEGRVLEALGGTYQERHDPQRAADWYGRALALRQERGETFHEARLHGRIGALFTYDGRYGPALREWRAAAGAYRRLADLGAQARALTEAARVQEYAGYPEDALRTCRDALYWARKAGERRLEGAILLRLADTLDRLGDPSGATVQRAAANRLLSEGESAPN